MAYNAQLTEWSQSVYLTIKNRFYGNISSASGQTFIEQVMVWTNGMLDELETVANADGKPVDWKWLRQMDYELGTDVSTGDETMDLDNEIQAITANPGRHIKITVDGSIVSRWTVVDPVQLTNRRQYYSSPFVDVYNQLAPQDFVAQVGQTLQFSRPLQAFENNGTVTGDAIISVPRLTSNNVRALTIIKPLQLLRLGVAKNASLPDIVQGGLSPSFVQKYNDLLQATIARNQDSSESAKPARDNNNFIGGVGF